MVAQHIRYIGSKRKLLPHILDAITKIEVVGGAGVMVFDAFSGSGRVTEYLLDQGRRVWANDMSPIAHLIGQHLVGDLPPASSEDLSYDSTATVAEPRISRYWSGTFYSTDNALRADQFLFGAGPVPSLLRRLTCVYGLDRVDATTGVQRAYLKSPAPSSRFWKDIEFLPLEDRPKQGETTNLDVLRAYEKYPEVLEGCTAYFDPPYNENQYFATYHIYNAITQNFEGFGDPYGVAQKSQVCKDPETKSDFCSKRRAAQAFEDMIKKCPAPRMVISYSEDGFVALEQIVQMIKDSGRKCEVVEVDHKKYNAGKAKSNRVTEYLICGWR